MKQYLSFFRMRFITGLQYRTAAIAGVSTQFIWGAMEILLFQAFYQADANAFPMSFQALTSYVWLQQAFLALYMFWFWDNDIFDSITNGNISYELCRPVDLYTMWFTKNLASRLSKAVLRCFPVLILASILPEPYGITLPPDPETALLFLLSMALGLGVVVSLSMVIYTIAFYTISSQGIRMITTSLAEFLSGAVIPLPFLPDKISYIVELLPFASIQNAPLRIYSGDIAGSALCRAIALQVFWLILLTTAGKLLMHKALKQVVVQGG